MSRWQGLRGILLDLDDTLYAERDYFHSGLVAVAAWLDEREAGTDHLVELQANVAQYGRQGMLDRVPLIPASLPHDDTTVWRKTLLQVYRNHVPTLTLFADVASFLEQCREQDCRLGLVTNGKSCVQWRKLWALNLDRLMDVVVVTDDIDAPKPSTTPFQVAAQHLGLQVQDCVYIADDASKDFIGPHELGMTTMQLQRQLRWPISKPAPCTEAEAHVQVFSLHEAAQLLFGDLP
jgi:putative hydrolase of the HAD superfamily